MAKANLFTTELLGYDPEERKRRRREQDAKLTASLLSGDPYRSIGFSIGQLFGAGASKLFGMEDSDVKRESDVYGAISTASSRFPAGSPEYYRAVAEALPQTPEYASSRSTALEAAQKATTDEMTSLRADAQFYEKAPEQTGAALADLARQLQINPNNPVALRRYNAITQAGVTGAMEQFQKQETAATEAYQKNIEFYKKNPEQAATKLKELDARIEINPQDSAAISERNTIAEAARIGAKIVTTQAEKDALSAESIRTTIAKNKRELAQLGDKFEAGDRWNAERQAAIDLFAANNLDPKKPLKGAALINTELVRAQSTALREPWGGTAPRPAAAAAPKPAEVNPIKAKVEAAGQVYDPVNYEYREGPGGVIQRKLKQRTP
jgi:hypothetical protein